VSSRGLAKQEREKERAPSVRKKARAERYPERWPRLSNGEVEPV